MLLELEKLIFAQCLSPKLDGRTMVISPPSLLSENNPGSWQNVFSDFNIHADFVSTGKLDEALELIRKREYKNIVIDEAHRFRNETTISYENFLKFVEVRELFLFLQLHTIILQKIFLHSLNFFKTHEKAQSQGFLI